jgi:ribonuclease HII
MLWHTTRKGGAGKFGLVALRDSKKLTPKQREAWYAHLTKHPRVHYAIARVYPRQIEKRNISRSANLAAHRAFARLTTHHKLLTTNLRTYLDGGLYIGNAGERKKIKPGLVRTFLRLPASSPRLSATTVVRGDEKVPAIAMASIIAKVHRDRLMQRLAKKYPGYGFELHKGYGTHAHLAAIRRLGPSPAHRLTFLW